MNELRYVEAAQVSCLDCKVLHNAGTLNMMRAEALLHVRREPKHRACVERTSVVVFTVQTLTPHGASKAITRADLD